MNALRLTKLLLEAPEDEASPDEIKRHLGQVIPFVTRPYTIDELRTMTNNGQEYIKANIAVSLWDLIENNVEWLNDVASAYITDDTDALEDIGFEPAGVTGTEVIITVSGSIQRWLTDKAEE